MMTGAREEFTRAQQALLQLHGVTAESKFLSVPTVAGEVHVLEAGTGTPVVLVPGLGDPAALWIPLMAGLDGFRLLAVDRPCFGLSGSADHTTDTIRSLAIDFLQQVLDALGLDSPALVGNSLGSLWCFWFAMNRPERVSRMVHLGCPAFVLGTSAPLPVRLLSLAPVGRVLMKLDPPSHRQVERFAKMVGTDLSDLTVLKDMLVAAQKLPGAQQSVLELLRAVLRPWGARPEVVLGPDDLGRIRQPVRLVWGERDPFGSVAVAAEVARAIPECEFQVMPGAGHVPWLDHPAEAAALTAPFLEQGR